MIIARFVLLIAFGFSCAACASNPGHRTAKAAVKAARSHTVHFEGSY